MDKHSIKTFSP